MKNLKDQKGITLVALVITIIVLLILAGVSLSLVVGDNGLLSRAQSTAKAQREAEIKEEITLELVNKEAEYYEKVYSGETITGAANAGEYALLNADLSKIKGATISGTASKNKLTVEIDNGVDNTKPKFDFEVDTETNRFKATKQS